MRGAPLAALAAALLILSAACEAGGAKPTATASAVDSADQVFEGFSHYVTANGMRRSLLEADTAYFYDATQTTELSRVHATFYDDKGAETSKLTADRATYRLSDGSMTAKGNVVVRTSAGATLRSPRLVYDKRANRISTDTAFVYDAAGDHIEGASFSSDPDFKNIEAERPRGTAGKPMVLPGQTPAGQPPK